MQPSIIVILLFIIIMACSGYYLHYYRPERIWAYKAQASYIFLTFILIPFLVVVLWLQSDAPNKLKKTGFTPHPSIQESVGIAVGIGKNPNWVFKTPQDKTLIFNFYRDKRNRRGWEIVNDSSFMLNFKQEKKKMTILFSEGRLTNTLIFSLTRQADNG